MGSGAFLVQVCRWLSERIVESWAEAERQGKAISSQGKVLDAVGSHEPLPPGLEDRLMTARRLIAERCLYGVDLNPLAVELAKLSIWLVTLAKGRPFGFLDHNLRCGDSTVDLGGKKLLGAAVRRPHFQALDLQQALIQKALDLRPEQKGYRANQRTGCSARRARSVEQRLAGRLGFVGQSECS
jgi:hypothetical protein